MKARSGSVFAKIWSVYTRVTLESVSETRNRGWSSRDLYKSFHPGP